MKLSQLWKSVVIGLSVGTIISSCVLVVFLFIGLDQSKMMLLLYLYYVSGGLTGYLVYKYLTKNSPKINDIEPKQELVNTIDYKQTLDKIKNLKRVSLILKGLVETRKRLEELKNENNSILEDVVEKMDSKSLDLTRNYLETS